MYVFLWSSLDKALNQLSQLILRFIPKQECRLSVAQSKFTSVLPVAGMLSPACLSLCVGRSWCQHPDGIKCFIVVAPFHGFGLLGGTVSHFYFSVWFLCLAQVHCSSVPWFWNISWRKIVIPLCDSGVLQNTRPSKPDLFPANDLPTESLECVKTSALRYAAALWSYTPTGSLNSRGNWRGCLSAVQSDLW